MPKERIFDIKIICRFCGNEWTDKWFSDDQIKYWNMCENCSARDYRGAKVRYAAAVRNPAGAIFADHHLERGNIYVISRVKQWIHGRNYFLEGFGSTSFDSVIFTPVEYLKHTELAKAYSNVPKKFLLLGKTERIKSGDLLWNRLTGVFVPAEEIDFDELAIKVILAVRPQGK